MNFRNTAQILLNNNSCSVCHDDDDSELENEMNVDLELQLVKLFSPRTQFPRFLKLFDVKRKTSLKLTEDSDFQYIKRSIRES